MSNQTKLRNLNAIGNSDANVQTFYQKLLLSEFPNETLYGAELGIAYGGGFESLCKIWGDRGFVYALDTFTGHPKELSNDLNSMEATCMDKWYQDFGTNELSLEYIDATLKAEGLKNYKLIKGLVHENSLQEVEKLHYVLLDLDIILSMKLGYEAIKDKMVSGGYLLVHDVVGRHLPLLHDWWFNEIMPLGLYEECKRNDYLAVFKVL